MALCDYLITSNIQGYNCESPMPKGAESEGIIINRKFIKRWTHNGFLATLDICAPATGWPLYKVTQGGKTPFNGSQQEMVEGANQNTITNTLQLVVLKQDENFANQLFALMNGEFVCVIPNKNGTYQVYGLEAGLHCSGAVRELYNDDTLSGWQVTMTEEGATLGNLFITQAAYNELINPEVAFTPCDDDN